jgi:hypothetical protein
MVKLVPEPLKVPEIFLVVVLFAVTAIVPDEHKLTLAPVPNPN